MPESDKYAPTQNRLIAALPAEDFDRLRPQLELVPLLMAQSLSKAGEIQEHAFFPIMGSVALHRIMRDGFALELATVGCEGVVGIDLVVGDDEALGDAVVERAGYAYRLERAVLLEEIQRNGALQTLLLDYTQVQISHIRQIAACSQQHAIEQQLCRWLLLNLDRGQSEDNSPKVIGAMLGVHRDGVAEAARFLQAAGLITYSDGEITVLDRLQLEKRVCDCYGALRQGFDRMRPAADSSLRP